MNGGSLAGSITRLLHGMHGLGVMDAHVPHTCCMQVFEANPIPCVGEPETDVSRQQWLEDMDVNVSPCHANFVSAP
jgi:hypothetical protein